MATGALQLWLQPQIAPVAVVASTLFAPLTETAVKVPLVGASAPDTRAHPFDDAVQLPAGGGPGGAGVQTRIVPDAPTTTVVGPVELTASRAVPTGSTVAGGVTLVQIATAGGGWGADPAGPATPTAQFALQAQITPVPVAVVVPTA